MLLGIDICSTERMKKALERSPFLRSELFSEQERAYCDDRRSPQQHYAARWAAKEACLKAHGLSPLGYDLSRLEVVHEDGGRPVFQVRCPHLESDLARAGASRVESAQLSLSHERDYAVACVVVTP